MSYCAPAARVAIFLATSILLACPAAAVDGEVLIDQAAALAGNVTPGDGPGFPVTISRRGKYKLTSTLAVPADTNGIDVTQHDVTIDLNGFTIRARTNTARIGISSFGAALTVVNGTILGFTRGGIVSDTAFAVIDSMRIINNREVGVYLGDGARVLKSTISGNRFGGIQCGHNCLIQQNLVTLTSLGSGILLRRGGVVLGNTIALNNGVGIFAYDAPVGFGNNSLSNNNSSGAQISSNLVPLHPNNCTPAC
jgi:hypothetical protein